MQKGRIKDKRKKKNSFKNSPRLWRVKKKEFEKFKE